MKYVLTVLTGLILLTSSNLFALGGFVDTYQWEYPLNYFPLENSDPMQKWVLKQEFSFSEKRFELSEYNALPANHGDAHVCLYEDDKEACFTLTCDVSYWEDEDWWIKVQNDIGVQVTHFVVTDRIDHYVGSGWSTWEGVRKVYNAGIALGSHSSTHSSVELFTSGAINYVYDYKVAKEVLEDSLDNFICYTIAHPGGGYGNDSDSIAMFYNGRRGTAAKPNRPYQVQYNNSYSASSWKQEHFDSILDSSSLNWRGYYSIMKHGMRDSAARAEHEVYFNYVKSYEDRVWITSYPDIMRYGQERDTHTLTVNSVTADMIKFTITDSMHDTIFTYPLTVKVRVDEGWTTAFATQAGKVMETAFKTQDGAKFVLVKAVPDQGEVTLTTVLGNIAPAITSTAVTAAFVGSLYTYDVDANDDDIDEVLIYSLTTSPAGMVIDSVTGIISWTPHPSSAGTEEVTILVTDSKGATDTQSWNVNVSEVSTIAWHTDVRHTVDAAVSIMTNPVQDGIVRININESVHEAITITVLDAHGSRVATLFNAVPVSGLQQIRWDAGGLSGMYIVSVKGETVNYTYRVIITE